MKGFAWAVILCLVFATGTVVGFVSERSTRPVATEELERTSRAFAAAGVESAATDLDRARFLLKHAIANMGDVPSDCEYVWNALQRINEEDREAWLDELQAEFLRELEAALLKTDTIGEFEQLLDLHRIVAKATNRLADREHPIEDVEPPLEEGSLSSPLIIDEDLGVLKKEAAILLRDGLRSERQDADRAEFMTQAALQLQEEEPQRARELWEEFSRYLSDHELQPFDRVARVAMYAEAVRQTLLNARSKEDFEAVWSVRTEVLSELDKAAAELASELANKIAEHATAIREHGDAAEEAYAMLGTEQAQALYGQAFVVVGAAPTTQTKTPSLRDAIRSMLEAAVTIAQKRVEILKAELDTEVGRDTNDRIEYLVLDEGAATLGAYESLASRVNRLQDMLDDADLESWVLLIDKVVKDPGSVAESQDLSDSEVTELWKQFLDVLERLELLRADVQRRQSVRYNLWALERVHRAETSSDWDAWLGSIEVGLLHPAVGGLYDMAYRSRIEEEADPNRRVIRIQRVLTTSKYPLSAF